MLSQAGIIEMCRVDGEGELPSQNLLMEENTINPALAIIVYKKRPRAWYALCYIYITASAWLEL